MAIELSVQQLRGDQSSASLDSLTGAGGTLYLKDGVIQEVRKREHYEKPSVKRKKKSEAARKRKFR